MQWKDEKNNHRIMIIAIGDIDIYYPKDPENGYFCKDGHYRGKLTKDLIKNGHWESNNWFEILELEREKGKWVQINYGADNICHHIEDAFQIIGEYLRSQIWSVS